MVVGAVGAAECLDGERYSGLRATVSMKVSSGRVLIRRFIAHLVFFGGAFSTISIWRMIPESEKRVRWQAIKADRQGLIPGGNKNCSLLHLNQAAQ